MWRSRGPRVTGIGASRGSRAGARRSLLAGIGTSRGGRAGVGTSGAGGQEGGGQCLIMGTSWLVPFFSYPLMKRLTQWSRAFCGSTRDFSRVYRAPATRRTPEEGVSIHGKVSASSPERVQEESPPTTSWVERWLPAAARPYAMLARLHKPDAIWLYTWPCLWSIAMAAEKAELPDMKMLALFGFGSVILRGVACTVNDLLDRDIDKKVERTKSRPLASGALTPAHGFYFLVFQVLLWLGFLLQLNNQSLIMGTLWLVLFFFYPLMKRLTHWPQAFLGFAMNCGVFLGSTAVKGSLDYAVLLPMYFAGICWTLVYDTIYAHQVFIDRVLCFYFSWQYYPFLAAAAGHLTWQVSTVDLSNKSDCNSKFVSNKWFGAFIFGGILCGVLAS
nr:unnamed protein product [Digitaria exilis]